MGSKEETRQEVDIHTESEYLHEYIETNILKVMNVPSAKSISHNIARDRKQPTPFLGGFCLCFSFFAFILAHVYLFCFCGMSTEIALLANSSITSLKK